MKFLSQKNTIFLIASVSFLMQSVMALTISSAPTVNVTMTRDDENNITFYTGTELNSNLNLITLQEKLSTSNVSIADTKNVNILLTDNEKVTWNSEYNLIVNASHDIIIGRNAQFISNGLGNLILRADYTADNDGTLIHTGKGPAIILNGGAAVKIYYHPKDYTAPTDFRPIIVTAPGTADAYMAINNFPELQKMNVNLKGSYALATNIEARGLLFSPIGKEFYPFTGKFDGQGYSINNLTIFYPNRYLIGFFGNAQSVTIENLKLINESVSGSSSVGGLVGAISGDSYISKVGITGTIAGNQYVGGLVGMINGGNIPIIQSFTDGLVRLREYIGGGLIGVSGSTALLVDNSYSTAMVYTEAPTSPTNYGVAGGLLGSDRNEGSPIPTRIRYSYATGLNNGTLAPGGLIGYYEPNPPNLSNLFWDVQTTKQNYSTGNRTVFPSVKGLTTVEMQLKKTYTDAFWDFNTIWGIDEGKSYPYLIWTRKIAPWTTVTSGANHQLKIVG